MNSFCNGGWPLTFMTVENVAGMKPAACAGAWSAVEIERSSRASFVICARCHIKLPRTLALSVGLAYEMERERSYFLILQKSKRTEFIIHKGISALSSYYMKSQARLLCCTQYMECNTPGCTQLRGREAPREQINFQLCAQIISPGSCLRAQFFWVTFWTRRWRLLYLMRISDVHSDTIDISISFKKKSHSFQLTSHKY